MNKKVERCPICNNVEIKLIHKGTRDIKDIDVYECAECGTKFLSVLESGDYENGFMNGTSTMTKEDIQNRIKSTMADDQRRFDQMKVCCLGRSVLDFGCGFGGFLERIASVAGDCCGVELGIDERNYMGSQGIHAVASLEELEQQYDVITLFHVFEHLDDPIYWLKKIRNYVKKTGSVFIEVPNASDALLSIYNSREFEDFTFWSAHLYLYTSKSLEKVINDSEEFEIVKKGQIQRYPLSNHLRWLAKGEPGGQNKWDMLNSDELNEAYANKLRELGVCDTLFFEIKPK